MNNESYDLIVIGTGFASSFFLREYLNQARVDERILVLERGKDLPYSDKIQYRTNSHVNFHRQINNLTPQKTWLQNIAFGGGACWTGNSPRMHPSDFKTRTLHGLGEDWPFDYSVLEPYLVEAEHIMGISGEESSDYPRSAPYSMPAHKLNAFDRLLIEKYGDQHIPMPSARASQPSSSRPQCCNNGVCSICPIGAKFQVDLHMRDIYDDPRVTLKLEHEVTNLVVENRSIKQVVCKNGDREFSFNSDFVALGAHGIMSPYILLNSGINDYAVGKFLSEQHSVDVRVNLAGVDNYDGGQRVTGYGSMFLNEANRNKIAGCAIENYNIPWLRAEFGKWRQVAFIKFVFEDLPSEENKVTLGNNGKPNVEHAKLSDYVLGGIRDLDRRVNLLLQDLPVEDYHIEELDQNRLGGSAHIQGTTRMGLNPETSVIDAGLIHHRIRNLAVLGSGAFPTCPTANPTLILSALSIKSARELF